MNVITARPAENSSDPLPSTAGSPGATLSSLPAASTAPAVDQAEQMVEGIDDEQQRLVVVDLEVWLIDPLELRSG